MTKLIGIDVGFGFVKVTDGDAGYSFPSVVGEGHTKSTFSTKASQLLLDDLRIDIGKGLNFVGKAAIKHSRFVFRDLSSTRSTGDDFEILFFSALSLFCDNSMNEFKVVTGLPVERMHLYDDLVKRVRGMRSITVFRNGKPVNININVTDVEIVPQPLGTYWSQSLIFTGQGTSLQQEGRTGVIDIGFRTSDLAAIEDFEYIPQKSKSVNVGLSTAYSDISADLINEFGLEKESYALDGIVIKRSINVAGQIFDISKIVDRAFEKLATNILVEVNSLWRIQDFDVLLLSGGGGQAVSRHLLIQLPQAKLVPDPITANCMGYLAWANRLWGATVENKASSDEN
ncbi:MAG: plasmid segregation protein ParM [Thermoanaerobacteraceae bacterium]|nr:plasmid segregation protein ParM [Thermoanaerobacteraceae bacterium]